MDAERGAAAQDIAFQFIGGTLFVERVTGFVERTEHRRVEPVGIEARSDSHVVLAEIGAKGMHGAILPPTVEIVAKRLDYHLGKFALLAFVKWLVQEAIIDG